MSTQPSVWEVVETDNGYDVFCDTRIVRYDVEDIEEVKRIVREGFGKTFILEEDDGYRTTHRL